MAVVSGLLLLSLPIGFAWWQFNRLDRVDVAGAPDGGSPGTNYLIVGSDSRDGIEVNDPNAEAFIGQAVDGQRADTIIVLHVGAGTTSMLSIPRDLWVTNPATGEPGRINSTYASGPAAVIDAVEGLGIPVDHYLEINFTSFGGLVDALGGITLDIAHPARDERSALSIPEAGRVTLDGDQALAYVRSRAYTELVDGQWRTDPTGDLGRVKRQREFLAALLSSVARVRNPAVARRVVRSLGPGLSIDEPMTFPDAVRLAWDLRGGTPASVDLPVVPRTTSGGAAVLELRQPDAEQVIAGFLEGAPPPAEDGQPSP